MSTLRSTLLFISLTACHATTGQTALRENDATRNWKKILQCDKAHVDVDTDHRTYVQLVVEDGGLKSWFPTDLAGRIPSDGQILLVAQTDAGIFKANFFRYGLNSAIGYDGAPQPWDMVRNGPSEMRFRVLKKGLPYPDCETTSFHIPSSCEASNYIFRDCKEVND